MSQTWVRLGSAVWLAAWVSRLSVLRLFVFYVPLALLGSRYFGYTGVFVAMACTNVIVGLWARTWNARTIARERRRLSPA